MEIVKAFQNNEIGVDITVRGTLSEPLFRASEIGSVLEFNDINNTIRQFNESEKIRIKVQTLGGYQDVNFLTEKGLYKLLFRSKQRLAEKFRDWVCDVVKELRLTGEYKIGLQIADANTKAQNAIEDTMKAIKDKELNFLTNFRKKTLLYLGFVEIINDNDIAYTIIKFGWTDDIETRLIDHKSTYGQNFELKHVFESHHAREIERKIKSHQIIIPKLFKKIYNNKTRIELIKVSDSFTLDNLRDIVLQIKNEVESLEIDKDKDIIINSLKSQTSLDQQQKNRLEYLESRYENDNKIGEYLYVKGVKGKKDTYEISLTSDENILKNSNFSYKSIYTVKIWNNVRIYLEPYEITSNNFNAKYAIILLIIQYAISTYDKYKILENVNNLEQYINRHKIDHILEKTEKVLIDISEDRYKKYIDERIEYGPLYKVTTLQIYRDFNEWYLENFNQDLGIIDLAIKDNHNIDKKNIMDNISRLTNKQMEMINVRDKLTNKQLSKYAGFNGIRLVERETDTGFYKLDVYKEFIKEKIEMCDEKIKFSRKQLCNEFETWIRLSSKHIVNADMKGTRFSPLFMNELKNMVSSETKALYDENTSDTVYSGGSGNPGCFMGLKIKSIIDLNFYELAIYTDFINDRLMITNNNINRVSKRQICDEFVKWLAINNYSEHEKMISKTSFTIKFYVEMVNVVKFVTKMEYNAKMTHNTYRMYSEGVFLGLCVKE